MPSLTEYGGQPGTAYGDRWWSAVHTLYDEAFPGLPAGIARARAAGSEWNAVTTPFALFEGDRCIAHVGLLVHPMVLGGQRVEIAGIHAVCTTADRRMRGHARRLLAAALAHADRSHTLAKLCTDDPPVYEGQGFRVTPTWQFHATAEARDGVTTRALKPLDHAPDRTLLAELLAAPALPSHQCATADGGWLVTIDAALSRRIHTAFRLVAVHDALVVSDRQDDGSVLIVDVIAPELPPAEVVLGAVADLGDRFVWGFSPDRFDPDATPVRTPEDHGHFMVRGAWPLTAPFGIGPLWEH